jgi:hypothetical protein
VVERISQVLKVHGLAPSAGLTPVYADLDKTGPGQSNTKPPAANWGGNPIVSNDFFQVQQRSSQL